jgi:hypothetical protein
VSTLSSFFPSFFAAFFAFLAIFRTSLVFLDIRYCPPMFDAACPLGDISQINNRQITPLPINSDISKRNNPSAGPVDVAACWRLLPVGASDFRRR